MSLRDVDVVVGGPMKRASVVLALIGLVAVVAIGQTVSETLRGQLKIQQALLQKEVAQLEEQRVRIEEAWVRVEREMGDLLRAQEQGEALENLELRDEDLRQAESELLMNLFANQRLRRELLANQATIAATEDEIRRLEESVGITADPITGTWRLVWEPGGHDGQMFLKLDGTLIQGTYQLSGGWSGSLRGTFISRKVRVERIDSQAGHAAVLNGRLHFRGRTVRLQGSWEAKELASGLPSAGTWYAERESPTER
jgi:hypothetical protein